MIILDVRLGVMILPSVSADLVDLSRVTLLWYSTWVTSDYLILQNLTVPNLSYCFSLIQV